jgi:hypothetical protein
MTNSLINFKNSFNGGTRPNRFEVFATWPSAVTSRPGQSFKFKVVSASLPRAKINTIGIPYRGRTISYAGDRSYEPWIVGIYDDGESASTWRALNQWKEALDGHYNHKVANNDYSYSNLQTTWTVKQLGLNGNILRTINLYKCWPNVIGDISLNMGETNFVAFNVSLTFDHMEIVSGLRNGAQI